MNANFSDRMMTVLEYVKEEALRLGDETIGVEHLILGIIREGEGTAVRTLNALGHKRFEKNYRASCIHQ